MSPRIASVTQLRIVIITRHVLQLVCTFFYKTKGYDRLIQKLENPGQIKRFVLSERSCVSRKDKQIIKI